MYVQPVRFKVDGNAIAGQLYAPAATGKHPAVVVCHGIPAKVADPGDGGYSALAGRLCGEGLAVLIFNFRGAGASGGNFDIGGWCRDLTGAIDYLAGTGLADADALGLLGFSAGAAVALCAAAADSRVKGVISGASPVGFDPVEQDPAGAVKQFRDIGIIRDKGYPLDIEAWRQGFSRVRPVDCIARIAPRPVLILHGEADDLVNISHARRLFERAGEPKKLVILKGAGHRLRQDEAAVETIIAWLREHFLRA